jgi:hypothetical protein
MFEKMSKVYQQSSIAFRFHLLHHVKCHSNIYTLFLSMQIYISVKYFSLATAEICMPHCWSEKQRCTHVFLSYIIQVETYPSSLQVLIIYDVLLVWIRVRHVVQFRNQAIQHPLFHIICPWFGTEGVYLYQLHSCPSKSNCIYRRLSHLLEDGGDHGSFLAADTNMYTRVEKTLILGYSMYPLFVTVGM